MSAPVLGRKSSRTKLDAKVREAKVVLRELRSILEDLEDRRELAAAKKRNDGKRGTPWKQAAKELGI